MRPSAMGAVLSRGLSWRSFSRGMQSCGAGQLCHDSAAGISLEISMRHSNAIGTVAVMHVYASVGAAPMPGMCIAFHVCVFAYSIFVIYHMKCNMVHDMFHSVRMGTGSLAREIARLL